MVTCIECKVDIKSRAGGRSKNLGGPALKDLDRLERLVNPTILNLGKSGGATAPLAPPVPPALEVVD